MEAKRILPWKNRLDDTLVASTCVGLYFPIDIGWRFFGATQEWHPSDTLEDAIAACEADYIARCTEFLRVAGPGQVVVDAAEVGDALDALCDTCAGECSMCRVKDVLSAIKEARDE